MASRATKRSSKSKTSGKRASKDLAPRKPQDVKGGFEYDIKGHKEG